MNPLLSLNTDITANKLKKDTKNIDINEKNIDMDFKNFLSNLLLQTDKKEINPIMQNNKTKHTSVFSKSLKNKDTKNNSVSLDELLNLVIFLKSNSLKGNFPTDSKKLTKILNNAQTIKEFKDIKTFKDLIKVAEKYDIKIKTFNFTKIENHNKQIEIKVNKILAKPNLEIKTVSKKEILLSDKILKNIKDKKTTPKTIQTQVSKKDTILTKVLNNGNTAINTSANTFVKKEQNDLSKKQILPNINQTVNTVKNKPNLHTGKIKQEIFNKKDKDIDITLLDKKYLKKQKSKIKKTLPNETKESSSFQKSKSFNKIIGEIKKDTHIKNLQKSKLQEIETANEKNNNLPPLKKSSQTPLKEENFNKKDKDIDITLLDKKYLKKQKSKIKKTLPNETKESSSFQKSKSFNKIIGEIKKDTHIKNLQKSKKSKLQEIETANEKNNNLPPLKKSSQTPLKEENFSQNTTHSLNNYLNTDTKAPTPQKSLNIFANDLKEQIENFKPPLMRIKMTLSPKDLGEVSVSLVSRGNNLQVTINSNINTMAIFTQNQAEFKNALVNMGFTNLNMNFSSNQNSNNKNQNHQKKQNEESFQNFDEYETESSIDTINIIMPKYV